jgi:hypothetical protein
MALSALACGGRTLGDGFEDEWESPGHGSGATGSGATGSGTTGSGATGSGTTGTGATGSGGFGATAGAAGASTGGSFSVGGVAGTFGVGGVAGAGAIGGFGGTFAGTGGNGAIGGIAGVGGAGGAGGIPNTCHTPLPIQSNTLHNFEAVVAPQYGAGIYVYTDTPNDDTPWSFGYIFPGVSNDLALGLQTGVVGSAFELLGYGYTEGSWGGGFGIYTPCIDASTAWGLRFYVKSTANVRVSVSTPANLPAFDGGECLGDYSVCVQNFIDIGAFEDFVFVELPWAAFNGGTPNAFDPGKIVGVGFQATSPDAGFDLWVDQVQFAHH